MHKLAIFFLLSLVLTGSSAACVTTLACNPLNPLCLIPTVLSTLGCGLGELPSLVFTLETGVLTQNLILTQNLASITLNTLGNASLLVNVSADITVGTISINGNTLLQVAKDTILSVTGQITVATGALLKVFGNVTSPVPAYIYGTLQLAGHPSRSANQNAWFSAPTVYLGGLLGNFSTLRGNGGISGDVVCLDNVIISAGNSPGVVYFTGNLNLSGSTTMIVEVDAANNFDAYIVELAFNRNNAKLTLNFNGFTPTSRDRIIFTTHSSSSNYFSTITGNISPLAIFYGPATTSIIYDDVSVSSYCTSSCTALPVEDPGW